MLTTAVFELMQQF